PSRTVAGEAPWSERPECTSVVHEDRERAATMPAAVMRRSVARLIDQLVLAYPRHHLPELPSHLLDRMLGRHAATRQQRRGAGAVLEDEAARVFSALDTRQSSAHRILGCRRDNRRPRDVLAVLGVVRDPVVHVPDAALVHEINDQLELMQALEVRHLGRVTCFDQNLECVLDQLDAATAKDGLLAEKIG